MRLIRGRVDLARQINLIQIAVSQLTLRDIFIILSKLHKVFGQLIIAIWNWSM